jgi:excisionase family DNA binding protein
MDQLDRLYSAPEIDPEKVYHRECQILSEVADAMAAHGHAHLFAVGQKTRVDGNRVKVYLSKCLKALQPESVTPDALTVSETAARLNVSVSKVYKLCESGELHCFKVGRALRISTADIETYQKPAPRFSHFKLR